MSPCPPKRLWVIRITECLKLEGTHKDLQDQLCAETKLLQEGLLKSGKGRGWENRDHSYLKIFFWWLER